MNLDSASAHPVAAPRLHGGLSRHILFSAVAVAGLLALVVPVAWSDQHAETIVASTAVPILPFAPPPIDTPRSPSSDQGHGSRFFGFLEFDWDPDAPGGVPGFDPWPSTQQRH
jgi:hypothetical protein